MKKLDTFKEGVRRTVDPKKSRMENFKAVLVWMFKLRSLALAIPVAVVAVILAMQNMALLPMEIGFGFGQDVVMVSKFFVVTGCLIITAICLLMTVCSKRVIYPWIISLFSLLLPIIILLTTAFVA